MTGPMDEILMSLNWYGVAMTTSSKDARPGSCSAESWLLDVVTWYGRGRNDGSLATCVTDVFRRTRAPDAFTILSKICQLPPAMDIAPSGAVATMVSRPWMFARLEA